MGMLLIRKHVDIECMEMGTGVNVFFLMLHSSGTCFVNWQSPKGEVWKELLQIFSSMVVVMVKKICSLFSMSRTKNFYL